jgi:two-component system sensor histidine kinase KdpD
VARKPAIALVDELAHSNIPQDGANRKRYQDILDLLRCNIDVVTTVNIQHLESLYDKVAHITGIQVRERVPDSFVDLAREIKLIDVSPETLQERLIQGKIYAPDKIDLALANFFQLGRLAALRELALVEVANNVEQGTENTEDVSSQEVVKEKILVCVSRGPHSEQLIRRGWRIADRLNADLVVLVVVASWPERKMLPEEAQEMERIQALSAEFQAEVLVKPTEGGSVGAVIVEVANKLGVSQIVIGQPEGRSRRGRWKRPSPVDYVLEHAEFVDLHVVGNGEGRM